MSTVNRQWYLFNGAPGGQHNHQNYFFTEDECQCLTTANNICCVLGIYSVTTGVGTTTYGTDPRNFAADPRLDNYITQAFASSVASPLGSGQMRYVFLRNF